MKITMLGVSGSGKTVYMSAMSELFFNSSVQGYTIANRINNYDDETFVNKEFGSINTLTQGKFPDGTASSVRMALELRYQGSKVIDIDWIDYRGGAIKELSYGDNSEQNAEIYATLIASDIIMVFVDAAVLKVCKNDMIARSRVGANEISQVLNWVARKKHIDVMFLLSKADSSIVDIEKDFTMLCSKLKNIYSRFLTETCTDISQYPIIAVGAVGRGNVETTYRWSTAGDDGKVLVFENKISNIENISTFNIASSFAKALLMCLESESIKKNTNAYKLERELINLRENFGLARNIIDILFNNSSRREQIYDLEQQILENRNEILKLESHKLGLERISFSTQ